MAGLGTLDTAGLFDDKDTFADVLVQVYPAVEEPTSDEPTGEPLYAVWAHRVILTGISEFWRDWLLHAPSRHKRQKTDGGSARITVFKVRCAMAGHEAAPRQVLQLAYTGQGVPDDPGQISAILDQAHEWQMPRVIAACLGQLMALTDGIQAGTTGPPVAEQLLQVAARLADVYQHEMADKECQAKLIDFVEKMFLHAFHPNLLQLPRNQLLWDAFCDLPAAMAVLYLRAAQRMPRQSDAFGAGHDQHAPLFPPPAPDIINDDRSPPNQYTTAHPGLAYWHLGSTAPIAATHPNPDRHHSATPRYSPASSSSESDSDDSSSESESSDDSLSVGNPRPRAVRGTRTNNRQRLSAEDAVALITAWYNHHTHHTVPESQRPTAADCQQLTQAVNWADVSPLFLHQVLPHLAWYDDPTQPAHRRVTDSWAQFTYDRATRQREPGSSCLYSLQLDAVRDSISNLKDQAVLGSVQFRGLMYQVQLSLFTRQKSRVAWLSLTATWPHALVEHSDWFRENPAQATVRVQVSGLRGRYRPLEGMLRVGDSHPGTNVLELCEDTDRKKVVDKLTGMNVISLGDCRA